jgi:hypothetical protein
MTEFYVFRGTAIGEVEEGVLEGFWQQLNAGLSRGLEFVKLHWKASRSARAP